jgi:hypothetical protein
MTHYGPGKAWSFVGASVTGTAHIARDRPCQDAWDAAEFPGNILVIAVADGAGSAIHAEPGARIAVSAAIRAVAAQSTRKPTPDIVAMLEQAFREVREELELFAAWRSVELGTYATTLSLVIVTDDSTGVAQTGDGIVVVRTEDGRLLSASIPQQGVYANETQFVTGPGGAEPGFLQIWEYGAGIAVLTDGLLPLAVDHADHTPHAPFFDPMLATVAATTDVPRTTQQLTEFLASDRVSSRTEDDKTLVLAARRT